MAKRVPVETGYSETGGDGLCRLTNKPGKYVKAHILPAALTVAGDNEGSLTQFGQGEARPIRRWASWYDPQLVTAEGEAILSAYDEWGIRELRRQKLVWSSWGPMLELSTADYTPLPQMPWPGWGIRQINVSDPAKLRVFFLSLLWRAAESKLRELRQIVIDEPYLTELRRMVRDADPNPLHLFPVELIQISSRGFPHNHTPMPMEKTIPAVDDSGPTQVPHYRFYFDGLIVHFDRRTDRVDLVEKMGPLYVGFSEELHVSTVRFENSFQRRGFESIVENARLAIERGPKGSTPSV